MSTFDVNAYERFFVPDHDPVARRLEECAKYDEAAAATLALWRQGRLTRSVALMTLVEELLKFKISTIAAFRQMAGQGQQAVAEESVSMPDLASTDPADDETTVEEEIEAAVRARESQEPPSAPSDGFEDFPDATPDDFGGDGKIAP